MIERFLDRVTEPVYKLIEPVLVRARKAFGWMPRPLDPFRSIKMKLSTLLGISGGVGIIVFWTGIGWVHWRTAIAAAAVGVVTLQFFAHGMTKPLREMTAAAQAMARGDYEIRVRATSRDEVGELARAFNLMAGDLAEADKADSKSSRAELPVDLHDGCVRWMEDEDRTPVVDISGSVLGEPLHFAGAFPVRREPIA